MVIDGLVAGQHRDQGADGVELERLTLRRDQEREGDLGAHVVAVGERDASARELGLDAWPAGAGPRCPVPLDSSTAASASVSGVAVAGVEVTRPGSPHEAPTGTPQVG